MSKVEDDLDDVKDEKKKKKEKSLIHTKVKLSSNDYDSRFA